MNIAKSAIVSMALAAGAFGGTFGSTIQGEWQYSTFYWKATWSDGNTARITFLKNGEWDVWDSAIAPYKIIFDTSTYNKDFWANISDDGNRGRIVVGEGGVEFNQRAVFSVGWRSSWYSGLGLNGSQTWSGTASGEYADAILGTPAYYSSSYSIMPVTFAPCDMTWTINRNLNV